MPLSEERKKLQEELEQKRQRLQELRRSRTLRPPAGSGDTPSPRYHPPRADVPSLSLSPIAAEREKNSNDIVTSSRSSRSLQRSSREESIPSARRPITARRSTLGSLTSRRRRTGGDLDDILDIIIGGSTTHRIGEDNRLGASSLPSSTSLDRDLHLVQSVNEHAVVPREREKYAKESQTADSFLKDGVLQNEQLLDEEDIETVRILQDEKDHVHESDVEEYRTPEAPESPLYASDDEKSHLQQVVQSERFKQFLERSSLLVEKCLVATEKFDPLRDYASLGDTEAESNMVEATDIALETRFSDARWTVGRPITSLSWCDRHPELFLAAYIPKLLAPKNEHVGLVLEWNMNVNSRPETVLHCESPVSKAMYHKYNPNVVLAGSYAGHIIMWDKRVRATPVFQSSVNPNTHTTPIFGLQIVGSKNSHNIVSASPEGRLCAWSIEDRMVHLRESLHLTYSDQNNRLGQGGVPVHSLAFPNSELSRFFVGCEDNGVYMAYRYGSKAGVQQKFTGHTAPITSIDCHPSHGETDLSDLFLSGGMDMSVHLWSHRHPTSPLHCFSGYEQYVYDIQWSPQHPALFATVDGSGNLTLWDLNHLDAPRCIKSAAEEQGADSSFGGHYEDCSLNVLQWKPDGRKILTGSGIDGVVHLWRVSEKLSQPDGSSLQDLFLLLTAKRTCRGSPK